MSVERKIYNVLEKAYLGLKVLHDDYFIIGSSALTLSGISIENTQDIDILMSSRDADCVKKVWSNRVVKNHITKQDNLFRSNFSRYHFEMLDIEIMGNLEVNRNGIWAPLIIQDYVTLIFNDIEIKIPTIEEQKRILNLFGREKDFEKLKLIEKRHTTARLAKAAGNGFD